MQRNVKLCSKSSPRNAKEKQIKLNVQKYDCHNLFFSSEINWVEIFFCTGMKKKISTLLISEVEIATMPFVDVANI